jgi:hypothetical protein
MCSLRSHVSGTSCPGVLGMEYQDLVEAPTALLSSFSYVIPITSYPILDTARAKRGL